MITNENGRQPGEQNGQEAAIARVIAGLGLFLALERDEQASANFVVKPFQSSADNSSSSGNNKV